MRYIEDPAIELLAIKLYEHDSPSGRWPATASRPSWMQLGEEDRDIYRAIAEGVKPISDKVTSPISHLPEGQRREAQTILDVVGGDYGKLTFETQLEPFDRTLALFVCERKVSEPVFLALNSGYKEWQSLQ